MNSYKTRPVMLFVPLFMQGDYPQKDRGELKRYALFAIPAIIPAAAALTPHVLTSL